VLDQNTDMTLTNLGEVVAFLGKMTDVNPQGFLLLLLATLQILGIFGPHICALEVASKDLLEILPPINQVSGQVIEPSLRCVGQVDGEEMDDE
jgi:hypothetical protein